MRVLITGVAGYLGGDLAERLAASGLEVTGTYHRTPPPAVTGVQFVRCELSDADAVERLLAAARPDAIVHAAAAVGRGSDPAFVTRLLRANVAATALLAAAGAEHGCSRFVYCSTISVYPRREAGAPPFSENDSGAPRDAYGASKRLGEEMLDLLVGSAEITAVSLRFAGIHGPPRRSGAIARLAEKALAGGSLSVDEPGSVFRFAFIDDAVGAIHKALAAELPPGHHRLNIGGKEALTLGALARRITTLAGSGARVMKRTNAPARQESLSIARARSLIGYSPQPLDDGLRSLLDWLRAGAPGDR